MKNKNEQVVHISSFKSLLSVWIGLIFLTLLTVLVSMYGSNSTALSVSLALLIASAKSVVVANYFMHLKFDSKLLTILGAIIIITYVLLILLTVVDYAWR